jgi:hypothetical protein
VNNKVIKKYRNALSNSKTFKFMKRNQETKIIIRIIKSKSKKPNEMLDNNQTILSKDFISKVQ